MFNHAYAGTKVLLTGDTGFKGSWLALWLHRLGAEVHGLALPPEPAPAIFQEAGLAEVVRHVDGDIRDLATVERVIQYTRPRIVFHLAAQALVRESYIDPLGTVMTNVMGTAHLCDALRRYDSPCALVVVTSDKCYENQEWVHGYRESDAMGGSDPYSASKGAAELIAASWRRSFFPVAKTMEHRKPVGSARAGNVIGPGDWAKDRIVPDTIRSLQSGQAVVLRNPGAIRPWQHVLEPLAGYLWLGAGLLGSHPTEYAEAWNFGPLPRNVRTVRELVEGMIELWGSGSWQDGSTPNQPHEATLLRLSIDKADARLKWTPVWSFAETLRHTVAGYRALAQAGGEAGLAREVLEMQIESYVTAAKSLDLAWAKK